MLNQKISHKESKHKTKMEKRIEEIKAEVEEILERLDQIEVEETWVKTWRTAKPKTSTF